MMAVAADRHCLYVNIVELASSCRLLVGALVWSASNRRC